MAASILKGIKEVKESRMVLVTKDVNGILRYITPQDDLLQLSCAAGGH